VDDAFDEPDAGGAGEDGEGVEEEEEGEDEPGERPGCWGDVGRADCGEGEEKAEGEGEEEEGGELQEESN